MNQHKQNADCGSAPHHPRTQPLSKSTVEVALTQPEPYVHAASVEADMLKALLLAKNSLLAFKLMPGPTNIWEEVHAANLAAVEAAIVKAKGFFPLATRAGSEQPPPPTAEQWAAANES